MSQPRPNSPSPVVGGNTPIPESLTPAWGAGPTFAGGTCLAGFQLDRSTPRAVGVRLTTGREPRTTTGTWELSRDLIDEALTLGSAGKGSARLYLTPTGELCIQMLRPQANCPRTVGILCVILPAMTMRHLVGHWDTALPQDTPSVVDLNAEIANILGGTNH